MEEFFVEQLIRQFIVHLTKMYGYKIFDILDNINKPLSVISKTERSRFYTEVFDVKEYLKTYSV